MSVSVLFCLSPGDKLFSNTGGGVQTFLYTGGRGGQTFCVGGDGGFGDVVEEIDVSEANISVSKASTLSAGARI